MLSKGILMESINIYSKMKFGYQDLMREVNPEQFFTLRDIFRACRNSEIPMNVLCDILHCPYILDYCEEAESRPFEDDGDVEYLEVYLSVSKDVYEDKKIYDHGWFFHGRGKKGNFPEELAFARKFTKTERDNYREKYAIEYTSMYELADLPIKISDKIEFSDIDKNKYREIDFRPSITLIDLLFAIFNELSDLGNPVNRNKEFKKLKKILDKRIENIKDGKTYSSKEVFDRVTKKINNIKKGRKDNGV
jgi:hypothetical protein